MGYNCGSCLYSNFESQSAEVLCDKKVLVTGKMFRVDKDKVGLPCPAHSDKYIEETRYMRSNKWLHESEEGEYCEICRRKVNLSDITQYKYIEVQDENGKIIGEKMQCRVCGHKGRR